MCPEAHNKPSVSLPGSKLVELLKQIQAIPGPSGDEGRIADFLERWCGDVPDTRVRRAGDLLLAVRGQPRVAVFAHIDTVGFTQAYDRMLIPIGGPRVEGGERVVSLDSGERAKVKLVPQEGAVGWKLSKKVGAPGERWVYADPLELHGDRIRGPYLDNRAGVWNALHTLAGCPDVAVVFTPAEEHTARGALVGSRLVHEELGISRALISDITWHTDWIKNGKGPAISYRDRYMPRQRFLEEVVRLAEQSGITFQREVERSGGSDGSAIERSTFPIDWVFIGAPQKRSHSVREECRIPDLEQMRALYAYLVPALSTGTV